MFIAQYPIYPFLITPLYRINPILNLPIINK